MSTKALLLALVVAYVGIVVLWCLTASNSVYVLAVLRARLRHGWAYCWGRLVSARVVAPAGPRQRRYLTGAFAAAAVACLAAVAVLAIRDLGAKGEVAPAAAREQQPADLAPPHAFRPLVPPVAAHSQPSRPARVKREQSHPRPQQPRERPTKVVSVVRVSARVTPPARATPSTQVAHSDGPAPLPAPAPSSAPSPLAAP